LVADNNMAQRFQAAQAVDCDRGGPFALHIGNKADQLAGSGGLASPEITRQPVSRMKGDVEEALQDGLSCRGRNEPHPLSGPRPDGTVSGRVKLTDGRLDNPGRTQYPRLCQSQHGAADGE